MARYHRPTRVGPIPSAAVRITVRYDLTKQAIPSFRVRSSVYLPLGLRPAGRVPSPESRVRIPVLKSTPASGGVVSEPSQGRHPEPVEPRSTGSRAPLAMLGAPTPRMPPRLPLRPPLPPVQGADPLERRARKLGAASVVAGGATSRRVRAIGRPVTVPTGAGQGRVGRPPPPGARAGGASSSAYTEATPSGARAQGADIRASVPPIRAAHAMRAAVVAIKGVVRPNRPGAPQNPATLMAIGG